MSSLSAAGDAAIDVAGTLSLDIKLKASVSGAVDALVDVAGTLSRDTTLLPSASGAAVAFIRSERPSGFALNEDEQTLAVSSGAFQQSTKDTASPFLAPSCCGTKSLSALQSGGASDTTTDAESTEPRCS
jgi:hypothetical protein